MSRSGNTAPSHRNLLKRRGAPSSGPAEGAIIIFAKAPVPGEVKTRMCPPLSPDEAASLHGSMVMDTVERTQSLREFDIFLTCTPSMEHPFFQTLAARHRIQLCDQAGEDLGQRMDYALTTIFNHGYAYALLVGTDTPTLSSRHYHHAKEALQTTDVVFGPTKDGGYYLVGTKHAIPELFAAIPWSTDSVLAQSQSRAERMGLAVGLLALERDIDTFDDVQAFLQEETGAGKKTLSTRTGNVFHALIQSHGNPSST